MKTHRHMNAQERAEEWLADHWPSSMAAEDRAALMVAAVPLFVDVMTIEIVKDILSSGSHLIFFCPCCDGGGIVDGTLHVPDLVPVSKRGKALPLKCSWHRVAHNCQINAPCPPRP